MASWLGDCGWVGVEVEFWGEHEQEGKLEIVSF